MPYDINYIHTVAWRT